MDFDFKRSQDEEYERYLELAGGRTRVAAALERQAQEADETIDSEAAMDLADEELREMRQERGRKRR